MLIGGIIFAMLEMLTFIVYHGLMYILLFISAIICIIAIFRFRAKNRLENVERRFALYGMVTIFICIILVIVAWMSFFYAMNSLEDARSILGETSHTLTDTEVSNIQSCATMAMSCLASFIILGLLAFAFFILGIFLVLYKIDIRFRIFLLIAMILMIVGVIIGSILTIIPSMDYINIVNNVTKIDTYDEYLDFYNTLEKIESGFFMGSIIGAIFALISSIILVVGVCRIRTILKSRVSSSQFLTPPASYQPVASFLQQPTPVQMTYTCPHCSGSFMMPRPVQPTVVRCPFCSRDVTVG